MTEIDNPIRAGELHEIIELDEIVSLQEPGPGWPREHRRIPKEKKRSRLTRRTVLSGIATAGFSTGMAALGVFPAAREARAEGYTILGRCYANYRGTCSPGCGPSVVCDSCCKTFGAHKGYHYNSSESGNHSLRPNQCPRRPYDGWLWKVGRCGNCRHSRTFRCHDGWWRTCRSCTTFIKSICKWTVRCT